MKNLIAVLCFVIGLSLSQGTVATAATDGNYLLSEVTPFVWDGTDTNRLQSTSADYDFAYGDETTLTYTLPFVFPIYGQNYNQMLVDGNGNIRFTSTGSASSFPLPNAGKGIVIVPWNNDLSSAFSGGVFVQHKTDGANRVVIEWQAETYSDEGLNLPNNFEAVIFPDGTIRFDYKSFTAQIGDDSGSGISRDVSANSDYINLSTAYGQVYTLLNQAPSTGRSFQFDLTKRTLTVNFLGTGTSTVTSSPAGIACNTTCSGDFPLWSSVTLTPDISPYDVFVGWSNGICTGAGNCVVPLNSASAVTATFNVEASKRSGTFYPSIQQAYNNAVTGDTIYAWDVTFSEGLTCDQARTVTIRGGYDKIYSAVTGASKLAGPFIIKAGTVRVQNITVVDGSLLAAPMMMTTTLATTDTASASIVSSTSGPALIERSTTGCKTDCDEEDDDHDLHRHRKRLHRDRNKED